MNVNVTLSCAVVELVWTQKVAFSATALWDMNCRHHVTNVWVSFSCLWCLFVLWELSVVEKEGALGTFDANLHFSLFMNSFALKLHILILEDLQDTRHHWLQGVLGVSVDFAYVECHTRLNTEIIEAFWPLSIQTSKSTEYNSFHVITNQILSSVT